MTPGELSTLTPDQKNARIAEACGWRKHDCGDDLCWVKGRLIDGNQVSASVHDLPDYCRDLNAMHEAEKVLTGEQCNRFNSLLMDLKIPRADMKSEAEKWSWHSAAAQRADAFLLTI